MMRRDQQTGDPTDGQVSLVINHAGKCGFDSLRSCAGRHWGERFRIGSNKFRGQSHWVRATVPRGGEGHRAACRQTCAIRTNHLDRPPGAAESDAS